MKVSPDGRVLGLADPALFDYPWIYMVEPGSLLLRDEEVPILRRYLLNGGVLMADDFGGGANGLNSSKRSNALCRNAIRRAGDGPSDFSLCLRP